MDEAAISQVLKEKQKSLDYVELMFVLDNSGMVIGATKEIPEEIKDCSSRSYFKDAMSGKTFVSKEYISTLSNNYNITISMPLYENGRIEGVILPDINLSQD